MTDLHARALSAWAETGLPDDLGADLIGRWSEPHRRYHDLSHLLATLRALPLLQGGRIEKIALWFHDAVHTGTPGTDEAASAVLAQRALTEAGLPEDEVNEVARLVLLTAHHSPTPDDVPGRRVSDADHWVLGAPPLPYRDSVAALRSEQPHLTDDQWSRGRIARVTQLLALPTLFHTPRGRALREASARRNLDAELVALRAAANPTPARRVPAIRLGS